MDSKSKSEVSAGILEMHRPDGKVAYVVAEDVVDWGPAEQGVIPNHNTTVYLMNQQTRDVRETPEEVATMVAAARAAKSA